MKYTTVYIPYILAWVLMDNPSVSFWISWSASLLLIFGVLNGYLKPQGYSTSWVDHPLRPLFIPHFIFAGYMALTSVFYFLSLSGYVYFEKINPEANHVFFERAAFAQSMYYLGHAGFLHGLLLYSRYLLPSMKVKTNSITWFILILAITFTIINFGLNLFPQLRQLTERTAKLSSVAAAIALALAIPERKSSVLFIASIFFIVNLFQALFSGWKENILVLFILLGAFLLPIYKTRIIITGLPFLIFLFFLLPTFNSVFRENAWERGLSNEEALQIAFNALQKNEDINETNWNFLTARVSEISMFSIYISSVPSKVPFYGFQILEQGIENLIPRVILPNKPITEELVMKRVRENGVISYESTKISAKPPIVVDAYLSFGGFGVWLFCFLIGWSSARISVLSENLFGGYLLGTCIFYTGLFNVYWRGNCFEFMLNTIVWSLVIMLFTFVIFSSFGILQKVENGFTRR